VHGISHYAEKPFPPEDFTASGSTENITLSWRKVGENIFNYRLYRRFNQTGRFFPTGEPFFIPGSLYK
jgi:hypothetical protein